MPTSSLVYEKQLGATYVPLHEEQLVAQYEFPQKIQVQVDLLDLASYRSGVTPQYTMRSTETCSARSEPINYRIRYGQ